MRFNNLLISASALAMLLSSCTFFSARRGPAPVAPPDPAATQAGQTVSSAEQKTVRQARESVSQSSGSSSSSSASESAPKPPDPKPEVKKTDYRYAIQIPGKEGFVFNPYTNNPVDVRGIPSGTLVRDPQDSNPDHKFRVP